MRRRPAAHHPGRPPPEAGCARRCAGQAAGRAAGGTRGVSGSGEQGGRRSTASREEKASASREGAGRRRRRMICEQDRGLVRFGRREVNAMIYGVELDAVICGAEVIF